MKMKKTYLSAVAILVCAALVGGIAGTSFYTKRHFKEDIVTGPNVTEVFKLSRYNPNLEGTIGDSDVYVLKGEKDVQPDFSGKEYLLERQLKPEARKDIIEKLAAANIIPTSMMDISDGLSSELMHICKQSNTGCRVYEEHIPIDYQTAVMAEEFNMNLTTCALNGGEDYELLFTVSIADHEKISQMEGVRLIGHITQPELGCALITRDGQEFELKAQGWNPLKEDK